MPHHTAFRPQIVIVQGGRAQKDAYDWVEYLNRLLELDPEFMTALVGSRIRCNYKIATHPTVQVGELNQMEAMLGDHAAVEPTTVPYDNKTRYEDSDDLATTTALPRRVGTGRHARIVYDTQPEIVDPVPSPTSDANGEPVIPKYHSAMNKGLADMPSPRWVAGMLGVINGFLGISEKGQGPVGCEIEIETGAVTRFFVSEPYERKTEPIMVLPEDEG